MKNADSENLYKLEGTVPLLKAVPVGLQHVLAMFIASVAAVVIFAGSCNVERTVLSRLIQNSFIITGLGTLLQLRPVGRLGSALPIVMGMSFTFLGTAIYIGNAYSVGTVMGWTKHTIFWLIVRLSLSLFPRKSPMIKEKKDTTMY